MADRRGELTEPRTGALAGAAAAAGLPVTVMPSPCRNAANAETAMPTGSADRARKLTGSSASSGVPAAVSRPWSTSSEVICVTSPLVTYDPGHPGAMAVPV